MKTEQLNRRR